MDDLQKAMIELEGLTKSVEPSGSLVTEALGELESATYGLQKSWAVPSHPAPAPRPRPAVDASTPMAKSAAAEASAHVLRAQQSFLERL